MAAQAQDVVADESAGIEACIRNNVARVEQAIESLSDATTFLTQQLCATAVAESARLAQQARQEASRQRVREMCENGELGGGLFGALGGYDPCAVDADVGAVSVEIYGAGIQSNAYVLNQISPDAISLAASLLLDARLARLASQGE